MNLNANLSRLKVEDKVCDVVGLFQLRELALRFYEGGILADYTSRLNRVGVLFKTQLAYIARLTK